jgi:glycerol uptake facilitator-like aquaporin
VNNKILAEFFGTSLLIVIITGSGVMGINLSNGNEAITLIANSIVTGAGIFVLITLLLPVSGAHFNPIVSIVSFKNKQIKFSQLISYVIAQIFGAIVGVIFTHLIFNLPLIETSTKIRSGLNFWLSELASTLILLYVIKIGSKNKNNLAALISLTVLAGYWFTSSTFFVNPAITIARSLTDTFVGIQIADVPSFISAQILALVIYLILNKN